MSRCGIYVEISIRADLDRVWELTQNPAEHSRWDLRFSSITPIDALASGRYRGQRLSSITPIDELASKGYRFRYERRVLWHTIVGTGTSIGERSHSGGTRTSALKFTTADPLSPLGGGRGYWRYVPTGDGVTFITGYDYEPGWGRLIDRLIMRRVIGWMTAWSFDRLRIWAESGIPPERWSLLSLLAFWQPERPLARRCRRAPRRGDAMSGAPTSLGTLEAP